MLPPSHSECDHGPRDASVRSQGCSRNMRVRSPNPGSRDMKTNASFHSSNSYCVGNIHCSPSSLPWFAAPNASRVICSCEWRNSGNTLLQYVARCASKGVRVHKRTLSIQAYVKLLSVPSYDLRSSLPSPTRTPLHSLHGRICVCMTFPRRR